MYEFLTHVKSECKKYAIEFRLRRVKYVKVSDKTKCGGYFDPDERILAVAGRSNDWREILVHEYAHLTQWVDDCEEWRRCDEHDSLRKMSAWLEGEEVKDIDLHIDLVKYLELDNEKRAVKLIKKWGIETDIKDYVRKANAYVIWHNYLKLSRKWPQPGNGPYSNRKLIDAMSSKFNMNYDKLSPKIRRICETENI